MNLCNACSSGGEVLRFVTVNKASIPQFLVFSKHSGKISITALHEMQTRSSDENSVRLSVCLSYACIVTKW